MIDLHCHTTASDSDKTPKEFIEEAANANVTTVAITDHDTVDGIVEALNEGAKRGVRVIPGIELSAEVEHGRVHVLGYHIDYNDENLINTLEKLNEGRRQRVPKIVEALQKAGINITVDEVKKFATGTIGRPHVAAALVEKGYETSIKSAMSTGVLADGGIADIKHKKLSPKECVELITASGGIPVLAHPYQTKLDDKQLDMFIASLVPFGLKGIETVYSEHTEEMTSQYKALASKYNLIETGGSDWHGTIKPGINLGVGRGNLNVPQKFVDQLDAIKLQREQEATVDI